MAVLLWEICLRRPYRSADAFFRASDLPRPGQALTYLALVLIFSVPAGSFSSQAFRTPELFGDARAVLFQTGPSLRGLIYNRDFAGVITGTVDRNEITCQIRQFGGPPIQDIVDGKVPCFLQVRGPKSVGWIDFRGHQRKFCGARRLAELPETCRLGQ